MGFSQQRFAKLVLRLGINKGKAAGGHFKWDKEGFYAWWHGVDQLPTPVIEEPTQEEKEAIFFGEEKGYVEDDLPFEEPDFVPVEKYRVLDDAIASLEQKINVLLREKEELMAVHEKTKAENEWLRNECDNQRIHARILEAQMEVVRLIFGGKNNG
jgi:hypothetical protein